MKATRYGMFFLAVAVIGILIHVWRIVFIRFATLDKSVIYEPSTMYFGILTLMLGMIFLALSVRRDYPVTFTIVSAGAIEIAAALFINAAFY